MNGGQYLSNWLWLRSVRVMGHSSVYQYDHVTVRHPQSSLMSLVCIFSSLKLIYYSIFLPLLQEIHNASLQEQHLLSLVHHHAGKKSFAWNMPFDPDKHYVAETETIKQVEEAFYQCDTIFLEGPEGSGKHTAVRIAARDYDNTNFIKRLGDYWPETVTESVYYISFGNFKVISHFWNLEDCWYSQVSLTGMKFDSPLPNQNCSNAGFRPACPLLKDTLMKNNYWCELFPVLRSIQGQWMPRNLVSFCVTSVWKASGIV